MNKIKRLLNLYLTDKRGFKSHMGMIYNRFKIIFLKWFFVKLSKLRKNFISIHFRPMAAEQIGTWSDRLKELPSFAIVMQGPLLIDSDFTLETIKIYKKHFIDTKIIVSTWEDEDPEYLKRIAKEQVEIVLCKKPTIPGIGNINMQLVSTFSGIKRAKEIGAQYVYKTRNDQRMYNVNINEYVYNLINFFPPQGGFAQKKRIIASSSLTLKYVPYLITDIWLFGDIDDMLNYWSMDLEERSVLEKAAITVKELVDARINESLICSKFLNKIGRNLEWSIKDWWQVLADHFIIIDKQSLDVFFYKYDFYSEYKPYTYEGIKNNYMVSFADWFNIYSNLKNKHNPPPDSMSLSRAETIQL